MILDTTGKRIQFLREHFGLTRAQFIEILNSSSATIYRLEGDKGSGPSDNFLNALKIYFLANPEWIKTGEGDMFISPEEYMDKGIEVLGEEKFSSGIIKILRDSSYAKLQSFVKLQNIDAGKNDTELNTLLQQVVQIWHQGDDRTRKTLVQFVSAFPEVAEHDKKKNETKNYRVKK